MKTLFKKVIEIIKANWSDPVWSKVISAIIISVGTSMLGIFYFIVISLYKSRSVLNGLQAFLKYLDTNIQITSKRYIIIFFVIAILAMLIPFLNKIKFTRDDEKLIGEKTSQEIQLEELHLNHDRSTDLLDNRIGDAFPGQRGLKWYKEPSIAVNRLQILLKNPLSFAPGSFEQRDPIWWFRGSSNTSIKSFESLTKTKVLINQYEYEIDEIAVNRDENVEKCFLYVKVKAEPPVGVYSWTKEDYVRNFELYGFHREEYGLFNNKYPIGREEYDDGSAIINGKVIESKSSKLRIRYLSPYNFIIAAKQSPINSNEFDQGSKEIMNGLLQGTHTFEQLFNFIQGLDNSLCP